MNKEIIKIRINLPTSGTLIIQKSHNDYNNPKTENDYYVVDWKDGHYLITDVLQECKETIEALTEFIKITKTNEN